MSTKLEIRHQLCHLSKNTDSSNELCLLTWDFMQMIAVSRHLIAIVVSTEISEIWNLNVAFVLMSESGDKGVYESV